MRTIGHVDDDLHDVRERAPGEPDQSLDVLAGLLRLSTRIAGPDKCPALVEGRLPGDEHEVSCADALRDHHALAPRKIQSREVFLEDQLLPHLDPLFGRFSIAASARACPKAPAHPNPGHSPALDGDGAIHDDVLDAARPERRLLVRASVRHAARVENDQIRSEPLADISSITQPENIGRQPSHAAHGLGSENSGVSRT